MATWKAAPARLENGLSLELKEVHAEIQGRPTGNSSETGSPAQTSQH
jgi:hypothetical protein